MPPARCCCCRGSTIRSCHPRSPNRSRRTWPRTASGTRTSPSRASRTGSARRRTSWPAWRPSSPSTARSWGSPRLASRWCRWRAAESAGEFRGPGLADYGDADLSRVGELLFDLLGDVAGDHLGLDVVDPVGLDHDPDLAAGLHREDLFHAFVPASDLLQALQALDVHLQRLAPGTRTAAAHRVRGLGEHRLDGADLDLVAVRPDGVHHVLRLAVAAGELRADHRVAALHPIGD